MVKVSKFVSRWRRIPELGYAWRVSPAWARIVGRYFRIGASPYPFQIPLYGGGRIQITSTSEVETFWQIFVRRCYRIPPDCATIVDAGANIGLFALWAARECPQARIISLEPFPQTFELLEENIRGNSLQNRVRALQLALAGENGARQMVASGDSPNHRLVLRELKNLAILPIIAWFCVN